MIKRIIYGGVKKVYKDGVKRRHKKKLQENTGLDESTETHNIPIKNSDGILQGFQNLKLVLNDDTNEPESFLVKDLKEFVAENLEQTKIISSKNYFNRSWFLNEHFKNIQQTDNHLDISFNIEIDESQTFHINVIFNLFMTNDTIEQSIHKCIYSGLVKRDNQGQLNFVRMDIMGHDVNNPDITYTNDTSKTNILGKINELNMFKQDDRIHGYYSFEIQSSKSIHINSVVFQIK